MTQELRKLAERLSPDRTTVLRIDAEQAGEAILSLLDRLEKAEKDAARLVWAMNWMRTSAHDYGFTKHVLEGGGTGDYSDCVTYIDAAMEASK